MIGISRISDFFKVLWDQRKIDVFFESLILQLPAALLK